MDSSSWQWSIRAFPVQGNPRDM